MYHLAYHLQANLLHMRSLLHTHTHRVRRYFLFRASPYTCPASDLSRFFLALFFMHLFRHTLHLALRILTSTYTDTHTHSVHCQNMSLWANIPACVQLHKKTKCAREMIALLLFLFVDLTNITMPHWNSRNLSASKPVDHQTLFHFWFSRNYFLISSLARLRQCFHVDFFKFFSCVFLDTL